MSVFVTDSTPCDNTPVLKITPRTDYKMPSWLKEVPTSFEPSGISAKRLAKKDKQQGDIIVVNNASKNVKFHLYKWGNDGEKGPYIIFAPNKLKEYNLALRISCLISKINNVDDNVNPPH